MKVSTFLKVSLISVFCVFSGISQASDILKPDFVIRAEVPNHKVKIVSVTISSKSSWLKLYRYSDFGPFLDEFKTLSNQNDFHNDDDSKVTIRGKLKNRLLLGNELDTIDILMNVEVDGRFYPLTLEFNNTPYAYGSEIIDGKVFETCKFDNSIVGGSSHRGLSCENNSPYISRSIQPDDDNKFVFPIININIQ